MVRFHPRRASSPRDVANAARDAADDDEATGDGGTDTAADDADAERPDGAAAGVTRSVLGVEHCCCSWSSASTACVTAWSSRSWLSSRHSGHLTSTHAFDADHPSPSACSLHTLCMHSIKDIIGAASSMQMGHARFSMLEVTGIGRRIEGQENERVARTCYTRAHRPQA